MIAGFSRQTTDGYKKADVNGLWLRLKAVKAAPTRVGSWAVRSPTPSRADYMNLSLSLYIVQNAVQKGCIKTATAI
jgi:hypothetical protein